MIRNSQFVQAVLSCRATAGEFAVIEEELLRNSGGTRSLLLTKYLRIVSLIPNSEFRIPNYELIRALA